MRGQEDNLYQSIAKLRKVEYSFFMSSLVQLLINAIAVFITGYILPGVRLNDFVTAVVVAVVLGVINLFIKPVLIFLTLPVTVLTLGLFILVINAVVILIVDALVPGFEVSNFWWALLFSLVLTIVNSFLNSLTPPV